jgi:hypothetical protein
MKQKSIFTVVLLVLLGMGIIGQAQMPVAPPAPQVQLRSAAELDQMLGPIALYPDPLIAQILPAATLPSEIVIADRYVNGGGDPNQVDLQSWDPSVKALARYPTVLKWMDDNLAWTTALGQAFLYQQQDVMDSIQRLRAQAQALGNLQSTPQETVYAEAGTIEILPANPQYIYVPVYQPEVVYYQRPFGSPFISFGIGFAVGIWLNHDFDWHRHSLIVWHRDQPRPSDWWFHRPSERPRVEISHATVWQPRNRPGMDSRNMDRGWDSRQVHNAPSETRVQPRPVERRETPAPPVRRAEPAPTERRETPAPPARRADPVAVQPPAETPRSRPATGALIGVKSSQETRQISNRGQESRQATVSKSPAPAAHVAAPAPARPAAAPAHSEAPGRQTTPGKH